jgi:hypothetical protein
LNEKENKTNRMNLHFLALVAVVLSGIASATGNTHSVHINLKTKVVTLNSPTDGPSVLNVYYNDTIDQFGWASLKITKAPASPLKSDDDQLWYAAGVAEGRLTAVRIYQMYVNTINPSNTSLPTKLTQWISQHIEWMETQVYFYRSSDSFWAAAGRVLTQLRGIADGYAAARPPAQPELTFFDLFVLNFQEDMNDVAHALQVDLPVMQFPQRCSGLIKPTSTDLFMTHTTWSGYNAMLRIYKDYDFGGVRIGFSSSPGALHSGDDWYILSNGLTVMETTNEVFQPAIYRYTFPQTVSEWIRVIVANNVGRDGVSWTNTYCRYNSGTYNNQYMVVNMNLYIPGTPAAELPDGLLWVTEQMPGMCPVQDVTSVVRTQGYWGSYNIPYFPELYVESGTQTMYEVYGDFFSYTKYARPMIFARDAPKIESLEDVKRFIRYNQFQTDPLSQCPGCNPKGNPTLVIANRADLVPTNGTWGNWSQFVGGPYAAGAIDAKIASKLLLESFQGVIISGPTYDDQVPFQWSTSPVKGLPLSQTSHMGQPDLQKFPWVYTGDLFPKN